MLTLLQALPSREGAVGWGLDGRLLTVGRWRLAVDGPRQPRARCGQVSRPRPSRKGALVMLMLTAHGLCVQANFLSNDHQPLVGPGRMLWIAADRRSMTASCSQFNGKEEGLFGLWRALNGTVLGMWSADMYVYMRRRVYT